MTQDTITIEKDHTPARRLTEAEKSWQRYYERERTGKATPEEVAARALHEESCVAEIRYSRLSTRLGRTPTPEEVDSDVRSLAARLHLSPREENLFQRAMWRAEAVMRGCAMLRRSSREIAVYFYYEDMRQKAAAAWEAQRPAYTGPFPAVLFRSSPLPPW